jgi:sugar-phosphatase
MTAGEQQWAWRSEIGAVLFDMDGTLVDSEHLAARAIDMLLADYGVTLDVSGPWFHGTTWASIARTLHAQTDALSRVNVPAVLSAHFHTALVQTAPPAIPGAPEAVTAAASGCATAVVSSSDRASVDHIIARLGLDAHVNERVTAEDCERSKPDPQCFQIAAQRLDVDCARCLVFEDSLAGLKAAQAAGMRTIAIGTHPDVVSIADHAIADFWDLPADFFDPMGVQ